jgi:hypothetical protein
MVSMDEDSSQVVFTALDPIEISPGTFNIDFWVKATPRLTEDTLVRFYLRNPYIVKQIDPAHPGNLKLHGWEIKNDFITLPEASPLPDPISIEEDSGNNGSEA